MTKGEFGRLVERYWLGQCSPEEIAFVEEWIKINGANDKEGYQVFKNEKEATQLEKEIWNNLQNESGLFERKPVLRNNRWIWGSVAACFALIVLSVFFVNHDRQIVSEPTLAGLETLNTSVNRQRITLPDCSIVTLSEGASIAVAEDYGRQLRTVRLKGEAFFEIQANPKVPFLVYSGDLVTEVLGTSFTIKPEAKTIEVSVSTGKVSVYSSEKDRNQRRRGVIITPNQKAVYDTESKTIQQDLVDNPKIVEKKDTPEFDFNFDDTPVSSVLSTLRSSYGMEIVVSNPELNDCVFTGNLNGFDLFKQLSYICNIIDAQYEVRGTTIFLTGEGCPDPM